MFYPFSNGQQDIVKDGLTIWLDAGDRSSYSGSGTTWTSLVVTGSNGSLVNGPTFSSADAGSIELDGTDDFVQIGTGAVVNESLPFTISVWFKLTELVLGKTPPFFFKTNTGANFIFIIGADGSAYQGTTLIVPGASAARKTDTASSFFLNNWVNVSITYNGSGATTPSNYIIYENSVAKTQNTGVGGVGDPRLDTVLGYFNAGNVMKGNIAIVQIYNKALVANDIRQNFNSIGPRFGILTM